MDNTMIQNNRVGGYSQAYSKLVKYSLLFVCIVISFQAEALEGLIVGKNATWARSVGNRNAGESHDGSQPFAPLYFWMTYHGSTEAIKYFKEKGALPIKHRWYVIVGGDTDREKPDEVSIPLLIGSDDKSIISSLAHKNQIENSFTWRTWSKKNHVSMGTWKVEVLYNDNTPVKCEIDGKLKPCVFSIFIE